MALAIEQTLPEEFVNPSNTLACVYRLIFKEFTDVAYLFPIFKNEEGAPVFANHEKQVILALSFGSIENPPNKEKDWETFMKNAAQNLIWTEIPIQTLPEYDIKDIEIRDKQVHDSLNTLLFLARL